MEIVARALVVFVFLWFVTRVVGRSTLGELSTFQLVLFVTMGDMVQQGVTQQDYSVTAAVLAVGTFATATIFLTWVNARFPRARAVVHGVPVVVVADGEPSFEVMKRERVSLDDLMEAARQNGIERIADVRLAVLETTGQLSFFTQSGADPHRPVDRPER
ncbi:DUF421 domain-containing protein [Luteimicrobium subarcticum]|uniref:Uncharacterized protein DUF421 n=1 Tax=Luteimicrobium subarcticum TaxID=620910 RepID=A0A2M8W1T0_9MICO|nr:YetF domain-containing protein [Luteimicrobium subarcticum]PJI84869.1 uncharacterized protein DUF421 [Luteimicrobium subarcticum]